MTALPWMTAPGWMTHARVRFVDGDWQLEVCGPDNANPKYRSWCRYRIYGSRDSARRAANRMQLVLVTE